MRRYAIFNFVCLALLGTATAQNTAIKSGTASANQVTPELKTAAPKALLLARDGLRPLNNGNINFLPTVQQPSSKTNGTSTTQCFTMHSYQFSKTESPQVIGETNCTDAKLSNLQFVDGDQKDRPKK